MRRKLGVLLPRMRGRGGEGGSNVRGVTVLVVRCIGRGINEEDD
jgi:hypothetical protein